MVELRVLKTIRKTMKRWHKEDMLAIGQRLFATLYKKKRLAHPNHDVHLLARELNQWLPQGIDSLIDGSYTPRFLKRHYFTDEVCDSLYLPDRILQHIVYQQLKPTFAFVMNPKCVHLHGPNGVGLATKKIKMALKENKLHYFIRADIKGYYKSISHQLLIKDLHHYYDDKGLLTMLKQVITNPIESPSGYQNPDHGIPIRGPLSAFFSGVFLKDLDDTFNNTDVHYYRYQDDILILCPTKRSLERSKQRLMAVLKTKQLSLSRKKTKIGSLDSGFHFLGFNYLGTQTPNNTTRPKAVVEASLRALFNPEKPGENNAPGTTQQPCALTMVPHPRTLRKARQNLISMVNDGVSLLNIKKYLRCWAQWWGVQAGGMWAHHELYCAFLTVWRDKTVAALAYGFIPSGIYDANYFLSDEFTLE
ncbi:MAG: reverse transcriptase/maturase family protein [bacterium]|nr:reverse transcriptase/maturase family protein [bacterium]